jgi:GNAT superfamily N-acetyltransferase
MRAADLAAISAIAAQLHPDHFERDEVFAERLALCPEGCSALAAGGEVAGYVFSHPWRALTVPMLDSLLGTLPAIPTTYYIHDIAVLPAARGHGAARTMIGMIESQARLLGLSTLSLVTVEEAAPFWRAAGFVETAVPAMQSALRSYGDNAQFMTRPVAASAGNA